MITKIAPGLRATIEVYDPRLAADRLYLGAFKRKHEGFPIKRPNYIPLVVESLGAIMEARIQRVLIVHDPVGIFADVIYNNFFGADCPPLLEVYEQYARVEVAIFMPQTQQATKIGRLGMSYGNDNFQVLAAPFLVWAYSCGWDIRVGKQPGERVQARLSQGKNPSIDTHDPALAKISSTPFHKSVRQLV